VISEQVHPFRGDQNYAFIWAMGRDQEFDDMDWVEMGGLR
jgi:5-keto 4-deoxyuronate isomerase